MSAANIASMTLLFLGVVLGPLIFFVTVAAYGIKMIAIRLADYRAKRYLQSLPCGQCQYFTIDEFLKCAVNPLAALTDDACHCRDFVVIAPSKATNEHRYYLKTQKH